MRNNAPLPRGRPPRPQGKIVMRPSWSHLLFLHWEIEAEILARHLPKGLEVDTFQGRAYVGLVPFVMSEVRPYFVPSLGRLGRAFDAFPELNVRTYVHYQGVPGVWFFSLDAAGTAAVLAARAWFKLPYFKARMRFWRGRDGDFRYLSRRLWPSPLPATCSMQYSTEGTPEAASPGSLEEFLVERYALYSQKNGQLYRGQVWHEPYRIQPAGVRHLRENCVAAAGLPRVSGAPLAHYSPGAQVEVWGLERL
jgi:uncharacterized protein